MTTPWDSSRTLPRCASLHGSFATPEFAAQLGFYLPFFKALKLYIEGMGRGPSYLAKDVQLPALGLKAPLTRQGMFGGGLSFRPHERVDFAAGVQAGVGGLAPWAITVRALVITGGKTYDHRAATPLAQLGADMVAEAGVRIKKFIETLPVDPKLDENCILLDYDMKVIGRFGKRTKDGYYCEENGFKVPIGHEFERDKKSTKLCRDTALKDCFLIRHGKDWVPLHRPRLDGSCRMKDSDGTVLGDLGTPSEDGKSCAYSAPLRHGYPGQTVSQKQPIGTEFYTDADRSKVCIDEALTHCFMFPKPGQNSLAWTPGQRANHAGVNAFTDELKNAPEQAKEAGKTAVKVAGDVADGRITVTTIKEAAKDATAKVGEKLSDPEKLKKEFWGWVSNYEQKVEDWQNKPPEEQYEDMAGMVGSGTGKLSIGAAVGGTTRIVGAVVGEVAEGLNVGKKVKKIAGAADHTVPAHLPKPHQPPHLVTPQGTVLPPGKDFNLVSDDPRKWLQIHGAHDHQPHGRPHTHMPEVHKKPDGSAGSTRRGDRATTAEDIDYADQALKSGEMKLREKRKP